jgi:hypothetical protein
MEEIWIFQSGLLNNSENWKWYCMRGLKCWWWVGPLVLCMDRVPAGPMAARKDEGIPAMASSWSFAVRRFRPPFPNPRAWEGRGGWGEAPLGLTSARPWTEGEITRASSLSVQEQRAEWLERKEWAVVQDDELSGVEGKRAARPLYKQLEVVERSAR